MLNLYKKNIIYKSFIYSLIYFYLMSKSKLFKKNYEFIKLINYILWVSLSLWQILFFQNNYSHFIIYFISFLIIFNFSYEILYKKMDLGHNIHHILTILFIVFMGLNPSLFSFNFVLKMFFIFMISMASSIFSSLKKICKDKLRLRSLTYHSYNFSYVLAKSLGIIFHYKLFFNNLIFNNKINIVLILSFFVHLTQLYFIYKILIKYFYLK
jgi:hypothetical protein